MVRYRRGLMWEHMQIKASTVNAAELESTIQNLGCHGWELVGFASADKTIGLNSLLVQLKRPIVPLVEPTDRAEGWKGDPSGRWDVRWWDGIAWTYDVGRRGDKNTVGRDAPTMRPPYAPPAWRGQ